VVALAGGVVAGVADEDAQPGRRRGILRSGDKLGEEGVGDVDHRHAEQAAATGAELACGVQRNVAEVVGDGADAGAEGGAHLLGAVQRVADRADRHAGAGGDVTDAHALHHGRLDLGPSRIAAGGKTFRGRG